MVLYRAIWPAEDPGSLGEAKAAQTLAIRYLQDVTPADLPQLQDVLFRVWEGPAKQRGSLEKFKEIYAIAARTNRVLPASLAAFSNHNASNLPAKPISTPKTPPSPKAPLPPKQPESRATCRACDGRGYTIKTNKDNIIKGETRVTCSRCGGTGFEPRPTTGKGGGRWRGSHQQEPEEEKDINRATDNFLKKHGFGKWGQS